MRARCFLGAVEHRLSRQLLDLHFMKNGAVLVTTTCSRTTAPACATVAGFALDSTTVAGRSQLAGLIAAETAERTAIIVGTGNCDVYGDGETIEYFYIVG